MNESWTRNVIAAISLAAAGAAAGAAQVVPTPGSAAGYSFFAPAQSTSTTGMQETLVTCYITPTSGTRTLVMSSRNWYGYTKPINVYYKMVGGGAGMARNSGSTVNYAQLASAGGSSVILKNGTMVAVAPGMSVSQMAAGRNVISGTFTVSSTDTLVFTLGGGAGVGQIASQYTGVFNFYGLPGGGGAGYYGGGSGQRQDWLNAWPVVGAAIATGGTGTAGGTGAANGGLGYGGSTPQGAAGGNGTASGASTTWAMWTGWANVWYTAGGGGGYGQDGQNGGDSQYCPQTLAPFRSAAFPLATTFDLEPQSGTPSPTTTFQDVYTNQPCVAGGARGEIVLQYQAPTCDLIPHWNQP